MLFHPRDVVGVFEEVSKECSNVDSKSPNVQQDKQVQKYYFGEKEEQSNDTQVKKHFLLQLLAEYITDYCYFIRENVTKC